MQVQILLSTPMFEELFKYFTPIEKSLLEYGFKKEDNTFIYEKPIINGNFFVKIFVKDNVTTFKVFDSDFLDEYTLHLVKEATGEYVGKIRSEIEEILKDVIKSCYKKEVFKSNQAKEIIDYIENNLKERLEFLFKTAPNIAISRRSDNKKWYIIIFNMKLSTLDKKSSEFVDFIDIRAGKKEVESLVDDKTIFRAYHMNKRHWISIPLNYSLSTKKLIEFINTSYFLALKR